MNTVLPKVFLKGIATHIPGLYRPRWKRPDSTSLARYGYSVWLRHLVMAWRHGFTRIPGCVAELGPGASLGAGLAALVSGSDAYYGLDVLPYADPGRDVEVLDELVGLFRRREPIPDQAEFPRVEPVLTSYEFPHVILTDRLLERALHEERIRSIRADLANLGRENAGNRLIAYFVPWHDPGVVRHESVDMVFSQAVMQYVEDLDHTYEAMRLWLKRGGLMSHQIGFGCHGAARQWNGHWAYSDWVWKLIRGRRPSFINRRPYSDHMACVRKFGFEVIGEVRMTEPSGIPRRRLAKRFRDLSDDDLRTAGVFIQATKGTLP